MAYPAEIQTLSAEQSRHCSAQQMNAPGELDAPDLDAAHLCNVLALVGGGETELVDTQPPQLVLGLFQLQRLFVVALPRHLASVD
eukprot:3476035-Rhodomonas_salina.2